MIPGWLRELPFWDGISPTFYMALSCACGGLAIVLAGIALWEDALVLIGMAPISLFLIFLFLLWRSHVDGGYRQR